MLLHSGKHFWAIPIVCLPVRILIGWLSLKYPMYRMHIGLITTALVFAAILYNYQLYTRTGVPPTPTLALHIFLWGMFGMLNLHGHGCAHIWAWADAAVGFLVFIRMLAEKCVL